MGSARVPTKTKTIEAATRQAHRQHERALDYKQRV
jgi:hypothetical protein